MSPCFIVRGQNPKRFRESEEKDNTVFTTIPSSPITTSTGGSGFSYPITPSKTPGLNLLTVKTEPKKSDKEKRKKPRVVEEVEETEYSEAWAKVPAPQTVSFTILFAIIYNLHFP